MAGIGGITYFNDVSGWVAQLTTGMGQYRRWKSFDTFGPLGHAVAHSDDIDINALDLSLGVPVARMQSSNAKNLPFGPGQQIEWLGAPSTLPPGNIVATGIPERVGHPLTPPAICNIAISSKARLTRLGTFKTLLSRRNHQVQVGCTSTRRCGWQLFAYDIVISGYSKNEDKKEDQW